MNDSFVFSPVYHRFVKACLSLAICLSFLVALLAPFNSRSVRAGTRAGKSAKARPAATVMQSARREGELLLRFRLGTTERQKDRFVAALGAQHRKALRGESGIEKVELSPGQNVEWAVTGALLEPVVEFAEPNFLITSEQLGATPDDPRFQEQWSLRNTG